MFTGSGGATAGSGHQLPCPVLVHAQTDPRVHFRSRADGAPRGRKCVGQHVAPQGRLFPQEHRFRRPTAFDVLPQETLLAGSRHTGHFRVSTTSPSLHLKATGCFEMLAIETGIFAKFRRPMQQLGRWRKLEKDGFGLQIAGIYGRPDDEYYM